MLESYFILPALANDALRKTPYECFVNRWMWFDLQGQPLSWVKSGLVLSRCGGYEDEGDTGDGAC